MANENPRVLEPEVEQEKGTGPVGPKIRCPLCKWAPKKSSRWRCTCEHVWNTFETGGVCPACLKQWTETNCHACHRWSPHSDWYDYD